MSCLLLLASVGACTPADDWRDIRPSGVALRMSMPCKPDSHQRQLALAEVPVQMMLMACQNDDVMFAVSHADVGDPLRLQVALTALAASAQNNLRASVVSDAPALVPGMTPHPASRRFVLRGQRPDGRPVQSHTVLFVHGTRIYQATVMGERPSQQAVDRFMAALAIQA